MIFERQPRESAKAFAAFSLYLSLEPQRSLDAVSQKSAKSVPLLKRWSRKYDWSGRVSGIRGIGRGSCSRSSISLLYFARILKPTKDLRIRVPRR